jgi:hypothetical protein
VSEDSLSLRAVAAGRASGPVHPLRSAGFAFGFVRRHFWQLLRVSFVPLVLAGVSLYVSLHAYLGQGLYYLQTGDTRAASLGLFSFVAGLMAAVFFYGVAVAKNAAAGLQASRPAAGVPLRPHAYWRIFTAYTRLLLCALVLLIAATALSQVAGRVLPSGVAVTVTAIAAIAGLWWLFLRAGFLLPAIAVAEQGPILRRAWSLTGRDTVGLAVSILLLLLPGTVIELAGEYLLRSVVSGQLSNSLFDYVGAVGRMLFWFVLILSAAAFLNIALLTAGSVYAYRLLVPESRR